MPLLSVIVPAFQRQPKLWRALRSITSQEVEDIELLVVDDGSSPAMRLPPELTDDPRVSLLRHDANAGPGAARNTGMKVARGEWLAFLESDDVCRCRTLASRIRAAEMKEREDPGALLIHACGWRDVGLDGTPVRIRWPKPANKPVDFVAGYWFSSGSAILFRREPVLAKAGLQDERYCRPAGAASRPTCGWNSRAPRYSSGVR